MAHFTLGFGFGLEVMVTVRRGRVIYRDAGCVSGVCSTVTIYSGSAALTKVCALLGAILTLQITLLPPSVDEVMI